MNKYFAVIKSTGIDWKIKYLRYLAVTDFAIVALSLSLSQILGISQNHQFILRFTGESIYLQYFLVTFVLIIMWSLCLLFFGARQITILGNGSDEYRRVIDASLFFFGALAILAYLTKTDLARSYFLFALPLGTLLLLFGRWTWRGWLQKTRNNGLNVSKAILIGSEESTSATRNELEKNPGSGLSVQDVLVLQQNVNSNLYFSNELEQKQTVEYIEKLLLETFSDTVIVTSSEPEMIELVSNLSWSLDSQSFQIVVSPNLVGFSSPRIHVRPTAGIPLFYLEAPRLSNADKIMKRSFDLLVSIALLIPLLPLLAIVACGVKFSSPGPIFYTQERIGISGRPFKMFKFRSMKPDADVELSALLSMQESNGDKPLFKVRNDPRVTRFGKFIRKYSIDELPQLINVLNGTMSLVGPRPQRQAEVDLYKDHEFRRLAVQPGLTGLWQVSGRSALSWEQAIEFDLYYVENWSFVEDIVILFKTFRAVLFPGETAH